MKAKMLLTVVVLAALGHILSGCKTSNVKQVPGHEPSLLPEGKAFKLVWQDEFDGKELDTSKWCYYFGY